MLLSQANQATGATPRAGGGAFAWILSQAAPLLMRRAAGRVLVWVWKSDPELLVVMAQLQEATPQLRTARAMMPMEYDDTESFRNPHLGVGEKLAMPCRAIRRHRRSPLHVGHRLALRDGHRCLLGPAALRHDHRPGGCRRAHDPRRRRPAGGRVPERAAPGSRLTRLSRRGDRAGARAPRRSRVARAHRGEASRPNPSRRPRRRVHRDATAARR